MDKIPLEPFLLHANKSLLSQRLLFEHVSELQNILAVFSAGPLVLILPGDGLVAMGQGRFSVLCFQ